MISFRFSDTSLSFFFKDTSAIARAKEDAFRLSSWSRRSQCRFTRSASRGERAMHRSASRGERAMHRSASRSQPILPRRQDDKLVQPVQSTHSVSSNHDRRDESRLGGCVIGYRLSVIGLRSNVIFCKMILCEGR